MSEKVNHPTHYNAHPAGIECIDVVEHLNFNVGNAIKYLWRADHKNAPLEDLEKAAWYINREIERRKKPAVDAEHDRRLRNSILVKIYRQSKKMFSWVNGNVGEEFTVSHLDGESWIVLEGKFKGNLIPKSVTEARNGER